MPLFYNLSLQKTAQRYWVGVIACFILGSILILAGVGKLFANLPNETEFLENLAPIFSLSEFEAQLLAYILPWVEIVAGLFLLLQVWPAMTAVILCVPLCLGFATNNLWMLLSGAEYEACNLCFGELEILLGSMTPMQALIFDGILFLLILVVVFSTNRYKLLYGAFEK